MYWWSEHEECWKWNARRRLTNHAAAGLGNAILKNSMDVSQSIGYLRKTGGVTCPITAHRSCDDSGILVILLLCFKTLSIISEQLCAEQAQSNTHAATHIPLETVEQHVRSMQSILAASQNHCWLSRTLPQPVTLQHHITLSHEEPGSST